MKKIIYAGLMFLATTFSLMSCNSKKQDKQQAEQTSVAEVMSVDSLLKDAPELVNKEVTFEGVCTHTCSHGATKMFLMGSDDKHVIRVEACKLGSFSDDCVNAVVKVTGVVKETRIDEAYLQKWAAKAKVETKEHGKKSEGSCASEKNARLETSNTIEGRINDFRKKIAERKAKDGKDYLSYYHVDAVSYEVEQ